MSVVAHEAIAEHFDRLGIDVRDRTELRRLGRDLVFLRGMREAAEEREAMTRKAEADRPHKLRAAALDKVVTFGLGLLAAYLLFRWGLKG